MTESFQGDSDIVKVPFLRPLLSANIDGSIKKKYSITYTKGDQQPLFLAFMNKCLNSIVDTTVENWTNTIAGKLIKKKLGPENENVFNELQKICQIRIEDFMSTASDQSQCNYVNIRNIPNCGYKLNITFPAIEITPTNAGINTSRGLWTENTWCNNCWLCGLLVAEKTSYPYTKQCEHILPFLTGSLFLGTATNNKLELSEDTKREYGQSHAVCNRFKNQGEFIKYDDENGFKPDIDQICNYVKELTGVKLDKTTGLELWNPNKDNDVVSTNTMNSFNEVFTSLTDGVLTKTKLAEDMYKTIIIVITTICEKSLSKDNIAQINQTPQQSPRDKVMAKLLYINILNYLVDSHVRDALILTQGNFSTFRDSLQNFHDNKILPQDEEIRKEVVDKIICYQTSYTNERIIERLKKYLTIKVPKPRKYMILAMSLYDSILSMISPNSFGIKAAPRRALATIQNENNQISKNTQKKAPVKKLRGVSIDNIRKEEVELLPYYELLEQRVFIDNLSNIINELGNITYGNLYSKLTYTINGEDYMDDFKFSIQNGKIILPSLVYTIYENFDRMPEAKLSKFIVIINQFFPLPIDFVGEDYLKIFSAYIYGLSVFNLLDYDLDIYKKQIIKSQMLPSEFGKKSGNLKSMTKNELKNKLKSVGILITKKIKEKRYPLTRKELEQKAIQFTKLQLDAKNRNIKITYIGRDGSRKYKSYKRLISDLSRQNNFGGLVRMLAKRGTRKAVKTFKPMIKYVGKEVKNEAKQQFKNKAEEEARKKALELKKRAIIEARTKIYDKNNVKVFKDKNNNRIITASRMG